MLQNIKLHLNSFFKFHYYVLFVYLDPFQNKPHSEINGKLHYQFIFALILFLTFFLHGTFGLELEYTGKIVLANLPDSNYTMFHHLSLPILRTPIDMVMLGNTIVTTLIFIVLIFHNSFPQNVRITYAEYSNTRHLMIASKNILVETVSKKILKISKLGRMYVIFVTFGFGVLIIYVYCYLNIFWVNADFVKFTFNSVLFWLIEFPFYFDTIIHSNIINNVNA